MTWRRVLWAGVGLAFFAGMAGLWLVSAGV